MDIIFFIYGGPENLEEVEGFVKGILGKKATPRVIALNMKRYQECGGGSPHLKESRQQVKKLKEFLKDKGFHDDVILVSRHWKPFARDVFSSLEKNKEYFLFVPTLITTDAITKPYIKILKEFGIAHKGPPRLDENKLILEFLSRRIPDEADGKNSMVIFTAHSLPASLPGASEYSDAFSNLARKITRVRGIENYMTCFQSQPPGSSGWLGPGIHEVIKSIDMNRIKKIFFYNLNFFTENIETLHDLDVQAKQIIEEKGGMYSRVPQPGSDDDFISIIGDTILEEM